MIRKYFLVATVFVALFGSLSGQVTTQTFAFTGAVQTFTVPSCVSIISITARGAQGGANANFPSLGVNGGLGGLATGVLTVNPGSVLSIYVGGVNGYNGGGPAGLTANCAQSGGGMGGGASDVRLGGVNLSNRVIVAGGGGGAGGDRIPTCGRGAGGGGGGGYYGGGGGAGWIGSSSGGTVASPGDQTAGGTGGTSTYATLNNGFAGGLGVGGAGGGEVGSGQGTPAQPSFPGGVGGGTIGGLGQSIAAGSGSFTGQSGAGGSSYIGGLVSGTTTSGVNTGNGQVIFSYNTGLLVTVNQSHSVICTGQSVNLSYSGASTYSWSTSSTASMITVSPTSNSSYTVNGTISGCTFTGVATITVSPGLPSLTISPASPTTCPGKALSLGVTGAINYTFSGGIANNTPFTPMTTTAYSISGSNGCGTTNSVVTVTVMPLPVAPVASPSVICRNSPSTLTAISAATDFSWSPGTSTLSSVVVLPQQTTVYTVTASDGTCSGTNTVLLTVNPIPTINIASSGTMICQGSIVTLTANGGVDYTWTPGNSTLTVISASPTAPTLFNVVGTNSLGCKSSASAPVVTMPSPTVQVSASSTLVCANDAVTLFANGATTYTWSTGPTGSTTIENPAASTVYIVTGQGSSSCTGIASVTVNVLTPSVSITGSNTTCSNKPVVLTATGADTYQWNTTEQSSVITVTPSGTTVYTVSTTTFSDNLTCPGHATFTLTVNPNPTVTAVPVRTNMCRGETNTITANGALTYTWSTGSFSQVVTVTATALQNINPTVTGVDANGCIATGSVSIRVNSCQGLNEENAFTGTLQVFPNPGNGNITIVYPYNATLTICNGIGQTVRSVRTTSEHSSTVQIQGLQDGVYFIADPERKVYKRIIVSN